MELNLCLVSYMTGSVCERICCVMLVSNQYAWRQDPDVLPLGKDLDTSVDPLKKIDRRP